MNRSILIPFFSIFLFVFQGNTQKSNYKKDSLMVHKIYREILTNGEAYENLRVLCKDIGPRLSGSVGADMAVKWGFQTLSKHNFDNVYLQEVMVPHWNRGKPEKGYYQTRDGKIHSVNLLALGGSISTDGVLQGEVIMFKNREDLENANPELINGKIVFLAERMKQEYVNTFQAYSESGSIRFRGASMAAKKGAKAYIMRSLSQSENSFPNTGTTGYEEGVSKIPAAAISTQDATKLEQTLEKEEVTFYLEMNCKTLPDKLSHNVIAEIKGTKNPNQIITVGGHLDSWDVGEGAHDDGAGIVQAMEALRVLKLLGYKPNNTIRVVLFMNEENGNKGGIVYAEKAIENKEKHIFALESDAGGFSPRGFNVQKNQKALELIRSFKPLFQPYFINHFEDGYGGVCISPLKSKFSNIALIGFVPDSQRYFDIHHNTNDVFENVNKRELHLGAAAITSLIYLLDSSTN